MMKVLSADHAVAWGVRLAKAEVIPAFPITPQTLIIELLSEFIFDGDLDAEFIPADSEHSAMSIAVGASAGGVRTFTATSSQGLALMHEMLYASPQNRLPVVMANVNRSLGAAAGIWLEHNDSMAARDSGWMQCYVEDNQEALDMTLQAYKVAEDPRVMLPLMICLDGFVLSHTVDGVDVPEQAKVDDFLPRFKPLYSLDPADPKVINPIVPPDYAMEMRYQLDRVMDSSRQVDQGGRFRFRQALRPRLRRPVRGISDGRCRVRPARFGDGDQHRQGGRGRAPGGREEGRAHQAALHAAVPARRAVGRLQGPQGPRGLRSLPELQPLWSGVHGGAQLPP